MNKPAPDTVLTDRLSRARASMERVGVDALLLSLGSDLPYLTGYQAMPLERLTMLVVPAEGDATLVVPRLEAMRVEEHPEVFSIARWDETDDPIAVVAGLVGSAGRIAIGDQTWARFLVQLLDTVGRERSFVRSVDVMGPLRVVKDQGEIDALAGAGAAADRVAAQLQAGEIELVGRTEAAVSADISGRLIEEGHERVNFAIVAVGENAASPHHDASERVIAEDEIVLCDFGGARNGYCSDITRCVVTGEASSEI
ncbi:MAG: M24 family metallopeptidase, partial [Actinomycetota bacterium]|nr:M24 family metallopeptidase [Actinomycetota bacterium]